VYSTAWCALWVAIGGYCLHEQIADGQGLDGRTLALIVLGGFFSIFAIGMASTSLQFLMQNRTTIDMFKKNHSQCIAVYIPANTPLSTEYETITYPLSIPPIQQNGHPRAQEDQATQQPQSAGDRDSRATRTFAILRSEPTENLFGLGAWGNFRSVMGHNIFEWLLPIRHSPCCNHDSMKGDYEFGEDLENMKRRYGIPGVEPKQNSDIELQEQGHGHTSR
jgi:palmitoyltransferase